MYSYAFLILLLPFLSFLLLGLLGMKMPKKVAGYIGTALMLVVVCLCYYTAYQYFFGVGREASGLYPTVTAFNLTWLDFSRMAPTVASPTKETAAARMVFLPSQRSERPWRVRFDTSWMAKIYIIVMPPA